MSDEQPENLRVLTTQLDEFRASAEQMRRAMREMCNLAEDMAKTRKTLFDAYVAEGFTAEQAFIMCQKLTY